MIIDDDDGGVEGGTSATTSDARRRICFDEEDEEEEGFEKNRGEDKADMCGNSAEVTIVQDGGKTLLCIASDEPLLSKDATTSHELLRLRLSTEVSFGKEGDLVDDGGAGAGSGRGSIVLSSAKSVESLIELWADQSTEDESTSCDMKPLDIAAICRAFESNLFEVSLDVSPSMSFADLSISLSRPCFDMCCASQLGAPPIPAPRKLPGDSGKYSQPHPSYTLMLALGTIFKGSIFQDVAASLGKGPRKISGVDNDVITAKMVYGAVDNSHAAEVEAAPAVRMNIPGLVPTLRPYQEAAVRWMLKREGKGDDAVKAGTEWELSWMVMEGPSLGASFGAENSIRSDIISLTAWRQSKKIPPIDSEFVLFCNAFTGWIASTYDEARRMAVGSKDDLNSEISGGILADSMGLGKTVEVLACILANPCPLENHNVNLPRTIALADCRASSGTVAVDEAKTTTDSSVHFHDEKRQRINNSIFQQKRKNRSTKPLALGDAVCICGRSSNYKESLSWVVCELCGEALHGLCAGFASEETLLASTKAGDRGRVCTSNHCPSCVAAQAQKIKSRATLIVTPPAILAQWKSEIEKHTLDPQTGRPLKVLIYPGMRELCSLESTKPNALFPLVHPRILADADVVLMSFQALMGDLSHSDDNPFAGLGSEAATGSRLRSRKRYRVVPSPLSSIHFWRICLDEAQRVETPTAASARMARKLHSTNRLCISGTPIGRGRLDDLFGLLLFLQTPSPFDDIRWFRSSFVLSQGDALERLSTLLQSVLWRCTPSLPSVRSQLGIPDLEERKVILQFSSVEKFFYEKQLQATIDVAQRIMHSSDSSVSSGSSGGARARRAKARDLDSLNNLQQKISGVDNDVITAKMVYGAVYWPTSDPHS